MDKLRGTLAALLLALGLVVGTAATASAEEADTRPCVTKDEYQDVELRNMPEKPGWTKARVNDRFDSDGQLFWTLTDHGDVIEKGWLWNPCPGWDGKREVHVIFTTKTTDLRAIDKSVWE